MDSESREEPTIPRGLGRRLLPSAVALAMLVGFVLFAAYPVVRLSSFRANRVIGELLALGLLWWLVVTFFHVGRWWMTTLGFLCALILGIATPFLFFITAFFGAVTVDLIQEVDWQGSRVRVYLIDGGATTDWDIEIRQERTIIPGLLFVRPIAFLHRCRTVTVKTTTQGIEIAEQANGCPTAIGMHFPLKRLLYF